MTKAHMNTTATNAAPSRHIAGIEADTTLINLCNDIVAGHAEGVRLRGGRVSCKPTVNKAIAIIVKRAHRRIAKAAGMVATGLHGLQAKAAVLVLIDDVTLAASLARDVLSLA
jgi:hypothetical protein